MPRRTQPATLGGVEAHALRARRRGYRPPRPPAIPRGQHHPPVSRDQQATEGAHLGPAGHGETHRGGHEVHRAHRRAWLGQDPPVLAAIAGGQHPAGTHRPAVPVIGEVHRDQPEPAPVLNVPVPPPVGGGHDPVQPHRPPVARRHELDPGQRTGTQAQQIRPVLARRAVLVSGSPRQRRRRQTGRVPCLRRSPGPRSCRRRPTPCRCPAGTPGQRHRRDRRRRTPHNPWTSQQPATLQRRIRKNDTRLTSTKPWSARRGAGPRRCRRRGSPRGAGASCCPRAGTAACRARGAPGGRRSGTSRSGRARGTLRQARLRRPPGPRRAAP